MKTETVKLSQIQVNEANPRTISKEKFSKLINSILVLPKMLEIRPIVVDNTMTALGGNMRLRALTAIQDMNENEIADSLNSCRDFQKKTEAEREALINHWNVWKDSPTAPVIKASDLTDEEQREFIIKDNVGYGEWDMDALANEWDTDELVDWGLDLWENNSESSGSGSGSLPSSPAESSLFDRFVVPPFSILDPVMAEIVCRWFGLKDGRAFDCFAGDSVFGFVSAYLGYEFTGVELREKQAALNNERVADMNARYICDDGQNIGKHVQPESQDLLFSCPPYFDLEVYSDLPNDASNQGTYEDFIQILKNAFTSAVGCLKENRFAAICVGDVRDKKTGFYYDFCGDIKKIFKEAGMLLYNEIILVEQTASTALRAARYMENRKVAKTHQHLLVFFKGDPRKIKAEFPKIEYTEDDMKLFDASEDCEESETSNNE